MFLNIGMCMLYHCTLAQALTQAQTNGGSLWGTLDAPTFPQFCTNNPLPDGFPWGNRTAKNSSPLKNPPDTGVTRYYDFTLSRSQIAPDGYLKNVILINGRFPGPEIEANWGDWVEGQSWQTKLLICVGQAESSVNKHIVIVVRVTNHISGPEEGTTLHWHGLLQSATPWYDGVPSVQQCPIAPGSTFTYRFKADSYGTSWYHSHYSAQLVGGLFGPMIFHGPVNYDYDIDLGPVILSDYYHKDYFTIIENVESTNKTLWRAYSDNNLINGKGNLSCSNASDSSPCTENAPLAKFKFHKGKAHRLRLVNTGAAGQQFFSIDEHEMTIIANDYVPIEPYTTKVVFLGVGQRTDVVVQATGEAKKSYWMRSNISLICNLPHQPYALAEIFYEQADTTKQPTSQAWPYTDNGRCNNDALSLTTPYYPMTPSPTPEKTFTILVDEIVNATGHLEWRLNQQAFRANYNHPLLLLAQEKNQTYEPEWNVLQPGDATTVRLVINNNSTISHPMHFHGHEMYILHEGEGFWDGVSITNPQNPQRRDSQMLRPNGHIVVQYDANNPGVWPFHCHIAWHLSLGLYMNILERPDDITSMKIPRVVQQTCDDWDRYSSQAVIDQIDAGIKE